MRNISLQLNLMILLIVGLTVSGFSFFKATNAQSNLTAPKNILIVESDTYVPATYQGAAPVSNGSNVRVIAVGPSQNYQYNWYLNGRRIAEYSGYGRNVLELPVTDRQINVRLVIKSGDETVETLQTKINPESPMMLFYLDHPTRGPLYQRALNQNLLTTASAVSIRGEVYGANSANPPLIWTSNRQLISRSPSAIISRSDGLSAPIQAIFQGNIFNNVRQSLQVQFSDN